jgi:Na+/H+-dicarboxylate symporter
MNKIWKQFRLPILLIAAMIIGTWAGGFIAQTASGKQFLTDYVKPVGQLFLNFLFMAVVPLVFASVASAVAGFGRSGRLGPVMGKMMAVFTVTGLIASLIMLVFVWLFPIHPVALPVEAVGTAIKESGMQQLVKAISVGDFAELLSKKAMLPLIIFAVAIGLATSSLGEQGAAFKAWLDSLNAIMMKLIEYIMKMAPIGILAWFTYLSGTFGSDVMQTIIDSVLLYFPVSIGYFFIFFTIYAYFAGGSRGIRAFWGHITTPSMIAFGTGSSMAAIPANLEAARKIGVPSYISELVIPIGATIHMDGSCISAVTKIALLSSLYGYEMHTPMGWLTIIGVALLSGIVMSGIPGGGKVV